MCILVKQAVKQEDFVFSEHWCVAAGNDKLKGKF